jgi:hypothetical protein
MWPVLDPRRGERAAAPASVSGRGRLGSWARTALTGQVGDGDPRVRVTRGQRPGLRDTNITGRLEDLMVPPAGRRYHLMEGDVHAEGSKNARAR